MYRRRRCHSLSRIMSSSHCKSGNYYKPSNKPQIKHDKCFVMMLLVDQYIKAYLSQVNHIPCIHKCILHPGVSQNDPAGTQESHAMHASKIFTTSTFRTQPFSRVCVDWEGKESLGSITCNEKPQTIKTVRVGCHPSDIMRSWGFLKSPLDM
jgi:hypothetical protein